MWPHVEFRTPKGLSFPQAEASFNLARVCATGFAATCKAGQGTFTIGPDSGFGAPFDSWAPKIGEMVGYMVSSVARPGVQRTVDQRTNVIVQPWRDTSLGSRILGRLR